MRTIYLWFRQRPLRFLGGAMVSITLALMVALTILDIATGMPNPYSGVITYLILPPFLIVGLLLVPIDAWIQRRRRAAGKPEPIALDLSDPSVKRVATFFLSSGALVLVSLTVAAYKGVEYMDTKSFCGEVCHKVMIPEFSAYQASSHASVPCVDCHIGPGAPWMVKSKLSGLRQVWHYARGDYHRPLPTPVVDLRPSRDTCENCHTVNRFYGSRLRTTITYDPDEKNTKHILSMLMHVGSGGVAGSGIHGHMASQIDYLPATPDLKEIAWLRVRRPDGSVQEFVHSEKKDALPQLRAQMKVRRMDCIDCHNRAAHEFRTFEQLVDEGITKQAIDPTLPFIKKQALDAVGEDTEPPSETLQNQVLTRISSIVEFYKRQYPDVAKSRSGDLDRSVRAIADAYKASHFPHMKVNAATYTNWRSHDGCWRCHGTMEAATPGKRTEVSQDCNLCHTDQREGEPQ